MATGSLFPFFIAGVLLDKLLYIYIYNIYTYIFQQRSFMLVKLAGKEEEM